MRALIFLDIDGVLNTHGMDPMCLCGGIHHDKIRRLNRLLFITGAKLVLSSAWRYIVHRGEANLSGMDWLLRSHGLHAGRLISLTAPDTMIEGCHAFLNPRWPLVNERGIQITEWLNRECPDEHRDELRYIVIDDQDLGISGQGHPFVQTDCKVGLTEADVNLAITLFAHEDMR